MAIRAQAPVLPAVRQLSGCFPHHCKIINLPPAQNFTQDRLPDHQLSYSRTKVLTARRRAGGVAISTGHAFRSLPYSACVGSALRKRQNIHVRAHRFNALFMTHPKRCSSSTISRPKSLNLTSLAAVCAYRSEYRFSLPPLPQDLRLLFGAAETGDHFDTYRPLAKRSRKLS